MLLTDVFAGTFNHEFSAQFTQGSGYGLSNIVRLGDCTYGSSNGLFKLGCNVALSSFKFMMNADAKVQRGRENNSVNFGLEQIAHKVLSLPRIGEHPSSALKESSPSQFLQGDTLMVKTHSISTSSQVQKNTYALIEIQGARGGEARLSKITVPSVTLTTSVIQGKLDLNSSR